MPTSPWLRAGILVLAVATGAMLCALWFGLVRVEAGTQPNYHYAIDTATLGLTLIQILLTILGLGLAALAVVGYSDIRSTAERIAKETSERVANEVYEERKKLAVERALGTGVAHPAAGTTTGSEPVDPRL